MPRCRTSPHQAAAKNRFGKSACPAAMSGAAHPVQVAATRPGNGYSRGAEKCKRSRAPSGYNSLRQQSFRRYRPPTDLRQRSPAINGWRYCCSSGATAPVSARLPRQQNGLPAWLTRRCSRQKNVARIRAPNSNVEKSREQRRSAADRRAQRTPSASRVQQINSRGQTFTMAVRSGVVEEWPGIR